MKKSNSFELILASAIYILVASANATPVNKPQEDNVQQPQGTSIQKLARETVITTDGELTKLAANHSGNCNAAPDPAKAQYIIGYGSLMQDESRKRTTPNANTMGINVVGLLKAAGLVLAPLFWGSYRAKRVC